MRIHLLASAVLLALGSAGAPSFAADVVVTKHHYVYYPEHQIYFAPETKVYYWKTGDRWESGTTLPTESQVYVKTGGVELDLDAERPYERHEWVLKHYRDHHDHD